MAIPARSWCDRITDWRIDVGLSVMRGAAYERLAGVIERLRVRIERMRVRIERLSVAIERLRVGI